jgi:hypothetical protein
MPKSRGDGRDRRCYTAMLYKGPEFSSGSSPRPHKVSAEDRVTSQNQMPSKGTKMGPDLVGVDLMKMISGLRAEKAQIDEAIRALEQVKMGQARRSSRPLRLLSPRA